MLNQDCILSQEVNYNCFSKELFHLLSSNDHNEILASLCMNNIDPSLVSNSFATSNGDIFQQQQQQQLSNNHSMMNNSATTQTMSPLNQSVIEPSNISHSSDTHSSPNPSINVQTTTSNNESTLLKILQSSPSSKSYSSSCMLNEEMNNDLSSMYNNPVTASCYQLIDEALKDTQSSLGLIWSKFDSNNKSTSNNITTKPTINFEQIYQQQQPVASFVASVSNQSPMNINENIDIFPFNLDSNTIDMLTNEKKKTLKRKQSTIESNLPSKKQTITYEILPMSHTATFPRPPIHHIQANKTSTDRRRKYKVRFGPNMFDEISAVKKNHKLEEVVRK